MEDADKSWREVRRELALNEDSVASARLLLEAEEQLERIRVGLGLPEDTLSEIVARGDEDEDDLTLLARYASALGGRLELRVVFEQETITLPLDR
jgi:hypothetical protein